jgi:tight adherence protein C
MIAIVIVIGLLGLFLVFMIDPNLILMLIYGLAYSLFAFLFAKYFKNKEKVSMEKRMGADITDPELQNLTGLNKTFMPWAKRLGKMFRNTKSKFINKYKEDLIAIIDKSGVKPVVTPETFLGMQVLWFLGAVFFSIMIMAALENFSIIVPIIAGGILFFFPLLNYKSYRQLHEKNLFRQLPDALDLLNLAVKAGMDFSAALDKLISVEKGPLIDEFFTVQQEVRMGKSREEALEAMRRRLDYKPVTKVLRTIIQALRMGVSLAPALEELSEDFKLEMAVYAEKLGAQAPIKMMGPLILLIFPAVFIVIFAPIALSFLTGGGFF